MKSPFRAIFLFCFFLAILATGLFASKKINPFNLNLNIFHLKPLVPVKTSVPEVNLNKQIIITDKDLEKIISSSAKEYVTEPVVVIAKDKIKVSADVIKPIKTNAEISLKVLFNENKVSAEIVDLKTGALAAPAILKSSISKLINQELEKGVNDKYQVNSISQETGKVIINVK